MSWLTGAGAAMMLAYKMMFDKQLFEQMDRGTFDLCSSDLSTRRPWIYDFAFVSCAFHLSMRCSCDALFTRAFSVS